MKYKNAMDFLRNNYDKIEAADGFPSLPVIGRNPDDCFPTVANAVFQIDVPFDQNILADTIADLTKEEVVLCLWVVTKCAV